MSDQYRQPSPYSTREQALAELEKIRGELRQIGRRLDAVIEDEQDRAEIAKSGGAI